jgi:SHAQKYF class myb-like DNA-binding protein
VEPQTEAQENRQLLWALQESERQQKSPPKSTSAPISSASFERGAIPATQAPAFLKHNLLVTARNAGHEPKVSPSKVSPTVGITNTESGPEQPIPEPPPQDEQQGQLQQFDNNDVDDAVEGDEEWMGEQEQQYQPRQASQSIGAAANFAVEVPVPLPPLPEGTRYAGPGEAAGMYRGAKKPILAGRWTKQEHNRFLEGVELHGKNWKRISAMVKTRTVVQTRTHAQKYYQKLEREHGRSPTGSSRSIYGEPAELGVVSQAQLEMQSLQQIQQMQQEMQQQEMASSEEVLAVNTFCVQVPAGPIGVCLKAGSDGQVYIASTSNEAIPIGARLVAVDGVDYRANAPSMYPLSPDLRIRFAGAIKALKAQPRALTFQTLPDETVAKYLPVQPQAQPEEQEGAMEEAESTEVCGPVEWCQKGLELERAQDYKGAIVLFSAAMALDPEIPVAAEAIRRCLMLAQWQESQMLVVAAAAAAETAA